MITIVKYIVAVLLLAFIVLMPSYLARQSGHSKTDMTRTRIASWILCWTFIGWLWALFRSTSK